VGYLLYSLSFVTLLFSVLLHCFWWWENVYDGRSMTCCTGCRVRFLTDLIYNVDRPVGGRGGLYEDLEKKKKKKKKRKKKKKKNSEADNSPQTFETRPQPPSTSPSQST
jgi:hypothetical protein